ncbi:hypothetical protein T484DRAFT_1983633 [Baffinella frigidus]|nr:hypothetical protein T484DRAFT_1983633 [Cryptophyta sp. CCMP2293]
MVLGGWAFLMSEVPLYALVGTPCWGSNMTPSPLTGYSSVRACRTPHPSVPNTPRVCPTPPLGTRLLPLPISSA